MTRTIRSKVFLGAACAALVALPACNRDRTGTADTGATATATADARARVTSVDLGRGVGADNRITDRTEEFRPTDTIHASVVTEGSHGNATITARWTFQDGQVVDETTRTLSRDGEVVEFRVSRPSGWPAGNYTLRILVNGTEVESRNFRVT